MKMLPIPVGVQHCMIVDFLHAITRLVDVVPDYIYAARRRRHGRKLLLLDSFVLTTIAAEPLFAQSVLKMIWGNNYIVAVSVVHLMETAEHWRWPQICEFISSVPFEIVPNSDDITALEVRRYPKPIVLPIIFSSEDSSFSQVELAEALKLHSQGKAKLFDLNYRLCNQELLNALQENAKLIRATIKGKDRSNYWSRFKSDSIQNMLTPEQNSFMETHSALGATIDINCIKSLVAQCAVIFEEYYVQGKDGRPSDIIDFFQFAYLPYVEIAVMDKARVNAAREINRKKWLDHEINVIDINSLRQMATEFHT